MRERGSGSSSGSYTSISLCVKYFTAFSCITRAQRNTKLPAMSQTERAKEKKNKLNAIAKAKQLQCTHTQAARRSESHTGAGKQRVTHRRKHTESHTQTQSYRESHRHRLSQSHTDAGTLRVTQAQASSLTHTHTANCMLSLPAVCALRPLFGMPQSQSRCPLLCLAASAVAVCVCILSSFCAAAAAALQTPLLLQSTPTIEAHRQARAGCGGRASAECRQNNMFVWIISYVALRCAAPRHGRDATLLCVRKQLEQAEVAWRRRRRRQRELAESE